MRFQRRSSSVHKEPEFIIIPMIDIMFFLLVFFMISTIYMVQQNLLPVNLPQAATAQSENQKYINITVTDKGAVEIGTVDVAMEAVGEKLQLELKKNPEAIFVLRGDSKAPYETIVTVLDKAKAVGIKKIAIATKKT